MNFRNSLLAAGTVLLGTTLLKIEIGRFSPQGGISVHPLVPLPNRGSYGQVVEAGH